MRAITVDPCPDREAAQRAGADRRECCDHVPPSRHLGSAHDDVGMAAERLHRTGDDRSPGSGGRGRGSLSGRRAGAGARAGRRCRARGEPTGGRIDALPSGAHRHRPPWGRPRSPQSPVPPPSTAAADRSPAGRRARQVRPAQPRGRRPALGADRPQGAALPAESGCGDRADGDSGGRGRIWRDVQPEGRRGLEVWNEPD